MRLSVRTALKSPIPAVLVVTLAIGCVAHETSTTHPDESMHESVFYDKGNVAPPTGVMASAPLMMARVVSDPAESWRYDGTFDTEQYDAVDETGFLSPLRSPLSTFSIDVDTASYSNIRRFLRDGRLPPAGAVRIEELVNYFSYDYPAAHGDEPFSITTELSTAPWNDAHQLLMIGLQGRVIEERDLPPRNLVFLLDVSGSMRPANKLPLVKRGLRDLVNQLRPEDHVAIVVYAGADRVVLPPTSGSDAQRIHEALANLEAGGSTNGAGGIQRAYQLAHEHFVPGAINRVILATDGDFNIGVTNRSELVDLIEQQRKGGVFLTVLGVGSGNLKDATMEELADRGNGNYAYLDSIAEARKVLVQEAGGTLVTIAKDVKLQIEFNPEQVAGYRLIGYENRRLEDRDFNDDAKDAGEIGAGHSVTALYEIVPVGVEVETGDVDALRYAQELEARGASGPSGELALLKIRYKAPQAERSSRLEQPVAARALSATEASEAMRFSSAVALFGMLLRDSEAELRGDGDYAMVRELARAALGRDKHGHRAEFLSLVAQASELSDRQAARSRAAPAAG